MDESSSDLFDFHIFFVQLSHEQKGIGNKDFKILV